MTPDHIMPPITDHGPLETMARAIYESQWVGEYPTEGIEHAMAIQNANAAVEALKEAGYAIVPVEPTEGMEEAGHDAMAPHDHHPFMIDIYRAMLRAAPPLNTKEGE